MPSDLRQAVGFLIGVWLALVLLAPLAARGEAKETLRGEARETLRGEARETLRGEARETLRSEARQSGPGLSADTSGLGQLEERLHEAVNRWREGRRLIPLRRMASLDEAARRHSADMASRGYLAHVSPEGRNPVDRILSVGVPEFTLAGENVGLTNRADPNGEVLEGWIASPDHFENLVAPAYNATGIGIARRADGTLFYTQLYVTFPR